MCLLPLHITLEDLAMQTEIALHPWLQTQTFAFSRNRHPLLTLPAREHAQGPPSSASYTPLRWAATICWGIKAAVWRSIKGLREGMRNACCPQRKGDSPSVPPVSPLLLTRMQETGYLALLLRAWSCARYGFSGKNGYMLLIHKVLYWIEHAELLKIRNLT